MASLSAWYLYRVSPDVRLSSRAWSLGTICVLKQLVVGVRGAVTNIGMLMELLESEEGRSVMAFIVRMLVDGLGD